MRISDLIKMGLRNLSRRKTRTILTVFGVVIGSLSIIIMRSIGHGMEKNFETQIKQLGSLTKITVSTDGYSVGKNGEYIEGQQQKLDDNLINQLKQIKHVRAVTPVIQNYSAALYCGKYQSGIGLIAMDSSVFDDFDFPKLTFGQYPSEEDETPIIFGFSQPWEFYDTRNWRAQPKQIDIEKEKLELRFQEYQVSEKKKEFRLPITSKGKMVETKTEFDYSTYIDLEYYKKVYKKYCNTLTLEDRKRAIRSLEEYQMIWLNVDNIDNVEEVQNKIKELGFQSISNMQFLLPMMNASNTLQMVLLALGAIAMFVSAISIANTMVMSIYERTKEIGVMKVLGCVIKDIRKLFLFEAGMIGFIGGSIGIILGYIISFFINKYGQPLFGSLMNIQLVGVADNATFSIIPIYLPFMAMGISIGVGLLSGYFPARRATKISAIEAMKSEG